MPRSSRLFGIPLCFILASVGCGVNNVPQDPCADPRTLLGGIYRAATRLRIETDDLINRQRFSQLRRDLNFELHIVRDALWSCTEPNRVKVNPIMGEYEQISAIYRVCEDAWDFSDAYAKCTVSEERCRSEFQSKGKLIENQLAAFGIRGVEPLNRTGWLVGRIWDQVNDLQSNATRMLWGKKIGSK